MAKKPIAYVNEPVEGWEKLDAEFVPADKPVFVHFAGKCPKCQEQMEFRHPLVVIEGVTDVSQQQMDELAETLERLDLQITETGEMDVDIYCTCQTSHEKDKHGCGRYGVVHAEWS